MSQFKETNEGIAMAERITEMREMHKLNRPQMSRILDNMPATSLKNYENGYRQPPAYFIATVARCVGSEWALYILGTGAKPTVTASQTTQQQEAA